MRDVERLISTVRLALLVPVMVIVACTDFPSGWDAWAWALTALLAGGTVALWVACRSPWGRSRPLAVSLVGQAFDTVVLSGFAIVYCFSRGIPTNQLLFFVLAAACVRFETAGGLLVALATTPVLVIYTHLRIERFHYTASYRLVAFMGAIELAIAVVVGQLVRGLRIERAVAQERAEEAEVLRDELEWRAEHAASAFESERRTVEELRRLSALRADFVSLVSHEVRTPMAAVIGASKTLRKRWRELTAEQRDAFLGLIAVETDRLSGLVGDVLDTSRIEDGTFSYSFGDVDLRVLITESVATVELGHENVSIATELAPDLPPVHGDRTRLRQVLTNLLDNAVKYAPEGSPIEIRAAATGTAATIEVVDHGDGIPAEDQQTIFEKFGRVRGTAAKPGSGLGLYIARAIAEAHDGALEVESQPGQGARFRLSLPIAP